MLLEGTWLALRMKSHTPECAKIEQFVATVAPTSGYDLCMQDFVTKDYTLGFHGRSITITQQQFDDGAWQEIVKSATEVSKTENRNRALVD